MNTTQINELESVYLAAVKVFTELSSGHLNRNSFANIFAPSFHVYGLPGEDFTDLDQLKKVFNKQLDSAENSKFKGDITNKPLYRSFSPNGEAAVYVDEYHLISDDSPKSESFKKGISMVFYKLQQGWRLVQVHFSNFSDCSTEAENFPKEEWEKRNALLQKMLETGAIDLKDSEEKLNDVQAQLLKQEKLASLGQLTAGIAHEIKNPLNFINNFSELSAEFLTEIDENLDKLGSNEITEEIKSLLEDVKGNLAKIHQHGTRADGIVKSMLLHSRGGNGIMEDTDLNALVREYVNLSFHGMRANKNPINVDIKIETDNNLGAVKLNPENFSRIILNLCKNAFDAMREKVQKESAGYLPQLKVTTRAEEKKVVVEIEDNGPGVPEEIKEKMMLPFFTTKKGSEGTGLGLSISQDIIKSHGGKLELDSEEGEYTRFIITLNSTV